MDFTPLGRFLDDLVDWGIPSCDIVVQRGHETLYRYMAGWRDREAALPLRGDEEYLMYSVSKPITAAAGVQLIEQGKMLLTDPVSDYLPEYARLSVKQPDGSVRPAREPMLVKHLFSMTGGLDYDLQKPEILAVLKEKGNETTTRDVVRAIAGSPLSFEPGAHWQYSLCHDVLAALIEVVSGVRFADYVRRNIFEPLGMNNSRYHLKPGDEDRLAVQYIYNDETKRAERNALKRDYVLSDMYDSGGAGLVSSLEDYALFADALACGGVGKTGKRILSRAGIDLMRANQLGPEQLKDFNWSQMTGYGYGLGVRTVIDRAAGGILSPVGEFGWGGAAGAYLLVDPENRVSVFYAQHMRNNQEPWVHPRLRNIVYGILTKG